MRLNHHRATMRPFPTGYTAMSTERINHDPPLFQIGNAQPFVSEASVWANLPETLVIKAKLCPIKRPDDGLVQAIVERQGQSLPPYTLYTQSKKELEMNGQLASIKLLFEAVLGEPLGAEILLKDSLTLFEKLFVTQAKGVQLLKQQMVDKKLIVTPPGKEGAQPLWGYGGYYRPGCDLKQIEQIFFTPFVEGQRTGVFLTRASSVLGSSNSNITFMDNASLSNLAGDIEAGKVTLDVSLGIDEGGFQHCRRYISVAFKQNDPSIPSIEITFKKGENHAHCLSHA